MKLGSLYQRAFKRLEPDDGKLSCPVLRGRRRWKLLLCYPTVVPLLLSPLLADLDIHQVIQELRAVQPSVQTQKKACSLNEAADEIIQARRDELLHATPHDTDFFIFVSTSLHKDQILALGKEAKCYGGTLILKGFVGDSLKGTLKELSYLFEQDIGLLIDPQLFEDYHIQHIPTFVLTDGKQSDSLSGSVSPSYALEMFAEKGELNEDAKLRLSR